MFVEFAWRYIFKIRSSAPQDPTCHTLFNAMIHNNSKALKKQHLS